MIVRSTVLPGLHEEIVIPLLEAEAGLRAGADFGVCVSPEFLRQRSAISDAASPRAVVIGELDARSGDVGERLNAGFGSPCFGSRSRKRNCRSTSTTSPTRPRSSCSTNCERSRWRSGPTPARVRARRSERRGDVEPGIGTLVLGPVGGPCLPKDLEAFLTWATQEGFEFPIISAVEQSNEPAQTR